MDVSDIHTGIVCGRFSGDRPASHPRHTCVVLLWRLCGALIGYVSHVSQLSMAHGQHCTHTGSMAVSSRFSGDRFVCLSSTGIAGHNGDHLNRVSRNHWRLQSSGVSQSPIAHQSATRYPQTGPRGAKATCRAHVATHSLGSLHCH